MLFSRSSTYTSRSRVVRRLCAGALTVLLLFAPMVVHGQDAPVQDLLERGQRAGADAELMQSVAARAQQSGLSAREATNLLEPAIALAKQDLPTRPFLNKTLEGLAKNVPPARMNPVLNRLQTNTQKAGQMVSTWLEQNRTKERIAGAADPSSTERRELITNVTEAQQQDVPLERVEQFLNGLPSVVKNQAVSLPQVSVAVSVMPDLPGSKNNQKVTHQLLTAALNAGYEGESLRQLPAALESAQRETNRPKGLIARGVVQAIEKGTPASSVLKSLFRGSLPAGPPAGVGADPAGTVPGQGKPPGKGKPPGVGPPDNPGQGGGGRGGGNPGGG